MRHRVPNRRPEVGQVEEIQPQGAGLVDGFTDPKYTRPNIRFITDGWQAR